MVIYKATNRINNKSYIGLTTRELKERQLEHQRHRDKESSYFHRALIKYGNDAFEWEIIDNSATTIEELKQLEQFYIKKYNTLSPTGYNISTGGETGSVVGRRDYHLGNNPAAIKVINLTTMKVFNSVIEAAESVSLSVESIRKSLKDENKITANCYWSYYDKNKTYNQKIPNLEKSKTGRKYIINLTTGKEYKTISEAAAEFHIARKTIRLCCQNNTKDNYGNYWKYK